MSLNNNISLLVRDILLITVGLAIYAMAYTCFILPYQITTGGVAGIAAIVFYATGIEVQITYLLINAVFLIAAVKILGWKFCLKTIYGVAMLTFLLWLFQRLIIQPDGTLPHYLGEEAFMACVIGALLEGIALSFCFINNGSTGGTDIIAAIVNKYRNMSLGVVLMICDVLIISSCYFVFDNLDHVHRIQKVVWQDSASSGDFQCTLNIISEPEQAALSSIMTIIGSFKASLRSFNVNENNRNGQYEISVRLLVPSNTELDKIISQISNLRNIIKVKRS